MDSVANEEPAVNQQAPGNAAVNAQISDAEIAEAQQNALVTESDEE